MDAIISLARPARRRLQRIARKPRDYQQVRRVLAILSLADGLNVTEVAASVVAARSSVYRWIGWYETGGEEALRTQPRGRPPHTVSERVVELLLWLLRRPPQAFNYLRTRWTSEMLAQEVRRQLGVYIHPSTVRRLLPDIGFGWRRARPTLFKRDPRKAEKLAAIYEALDRPKKGDAVFFVDEADVELNPKIGFAWMERGRQHAIPTPGTNQKRYLAGALHAHTGRVIWAEGPTKASALFIALLEELRRCYRGFKRLVLIVDNNIIHKSRVTRAFLARNPKFVLLFQPVYHPWVNRIERLWKALHETVTRNHHWKTLDDLMWAVRVFLRRCQPFPGNHHGLVKVRAKLTASVAQFGSAI